MINYKIALASFPQFIRPAKHIAPPVFRSSVNARSQFRPASIRQLQPKTLTSAILFSYRSEHAFINFNKNYYEVLGVDQKATFQEIKQQFYLLAKQYHPDKTNGDQSYFKEINEAYNVLSQPQLKEEYDGIRKQYRPSEDQSNSQNSSKHKTLNYDAYSQLSREGWAMYRRGSMSQNKTDYTNYQKTFDPEKWDEINFKNMEQWNRAFRSIKVEQVRQQNEFRSKLRKKYEEDIRMRQREKAAFYESKLSRIGQRVQSIFGAGARRLYNKLVGK